MRIQKFIVTSLVTAIFAIIFVTIFEDAFAMFDFYDILIILAAIVSSTLGLIISKKFLGLISRITQGMGLSLQYFDGLFMFCIFLFNIS